MKTLSQQNIDALNLAFNEALILGVDFSRDTKTITLTISPIWLDGHEDGTTTHKITILFSPVGRFIGSMRLGEWDDKPEDIRVVEFDAVRIIDKIKEFKQQPIYGWHFVNCKEELSWLDKLSFEFNASSPQGRNNSMRLFQEGVGKHLDIKFWFDDIAIFNADNEKMEFQNFIREAKNGWEKIVDVDAAGLKQNFRNKRFRNNLL